jgi:tetratricopeptide (TPR) repeat protein
VRTPRTRALPPPARFILVAALLLAPGPLAAAEDVASRARALIDQGRPAQAVPLLEEAAVAAPEDAEVVFLLGVAYQRTGRHEAALIALNRAAALAPDDGRVFYNLGAVRFALAQWDEAAEAFLAVPPRAPEAAAAAYLNAGLSRYKAGRGEEAKALLARAVTAGPESASADTARRMLDRLASGPNVSASPPPRPSPLTAAFYLGREYDSNVFARPDDATATDLSDWRTTAKGEVAYRMPLGGRFVLTPHCDLYGYWYHAEHAYNYRRHRAWLRLDDRRGALRPRLTWGYDFALLAGEAYLASHWLDGRLTLHRGEAGKVWLRLGVAIEEAPGRQYDYLSGTSWEAALSGYRDALAHGWVYAALRLRYRDRGTDIALGQHGETAWVDYSYASVGPRLKARTDLPARLELTAEAGYEVRRYLSVDRWDGPDAGTKRRLDRRLVGGVTLSRPVAGPLRITLAWIGQLRRSNVGNAVTDYRDRDYERQLYGVFLEGDW